MLTTDIKQEALRAYRSGVSLLQQDKFRDAIPFLMRAADGFRAYDAEGHPAEYALENGVSALANALYHLAACYERSGNFSQAITCLETVRINERFEHSGPFRAFLHNLAPLLVSCYEQQVAASGLKDVSALVGGRPVRDVTCRFPFSLAPEAIAYARLYELAPQRYHQYRKFYENARDIDSVLRSSGSRTDEMTMRKTSIVVWSVIAAVWIVYGIVVLKTLI